VLEISFSFLHPDLALNTALGYIEALLSAVEPCMGRAL